jgi:hypothetical protein
MPELRSKHVGTVGAAPEAQSPTARHKRITRSSCDARDGQPTRQFGDKRGIGLRLGLRELEAKGADITERFPDGRLFHLDRDRASEAPSFAHIEMVRVSASDCISRSRIALIGIAYATADPDCLNLRRQIADIHRNIEDVGLVLRACRGWSREHRNR